MYPNWLCQGVTALIERHDVGIVTGVRREQYRDRSIYNLLCDLEWDGKRGDIAACGGDFMVRAAVYRQIRGFNPTVIAAEDDEFCIRTRTSGWRIVRLDTDMTSHDANMLTFGQWWRRSVRAGHAFAQVGSIPPIISSRKFEHWVGQWSFPS